MPGGPQSTALDISVLLTCAGVSDGFWSSISSATPATKGVAMLVPLRVVYLSPVLAAADVIATPGAEMSGFIRPSAVGPRLENGASLNPLRQKFREHPAGLGPKSAIAPTVIAAAASPGSPTVHGPGPLLPAATVTTSPAATAALIAWERADVPSPHPVAPRLRLITRMPS